MDALFQKVQAIISEAHNILVIQAENPDGDSLGSALALEEILGDLGKQVTLYCPINIPKYLGYLKGWDRVVDVFPTKFNASIIVDTASEVLMQRAIVPENLAQITKHPVIVLDHHLTEGTLPFDHIAVSDTTSVATGELVYKLAKANGWAMNAQACEALAAAILSDSLGLVTEATKAASIRTVADLVDGGASLTTLDNRRREFMKKPAEILTYKGQLLQRIEYFLDGTLALVHIPWEEIAKYSDQYNPSMLAIDEMRLVTGVRVAVAIKTYPDDKITGKIRCNPDAKVAETIAGHFGGGGHPYVAGFRTYSDNYDAIKAELIGAVDTILTQYDKTITATEHC